MLSAPSDRDPTLFGEGASPPLKPRGDKVALEVVDKEKEGEEGEEEDKEGLDKALWEQEEVCWALL